jgi:hypothetical protein
MGFSSQAAKSVSCCVKFGGIKPPPDERYIDLAVSRHVLRRQISCVKKNFLLLEGIRLLVIVVFIPLYS